MGAWRCVIVPTTISRSAGRGVKRGSAAPKRSMSYRGPDTEKYSIPQHAVTKGYGKNENLRAQLKTSASRVGENASGKALLSSTSGWRVVVPLIIKLASLRRRAIKNQLLVSRSASA